ncbi:MAG: hypothetical protein J1F64_09710 [Oscillospiraceae bacterium]|nr:hypothetical protein [Oscillospiraceae bacterium]
MFKFMGNTYESDGCSYTGYDIMGNFDDGDITFCDISRNKDDVEKFVHKLNDSDVDKIHFQDVVDDFLLK